MWVQVGENPVRMLGARPGSGRARRRRVRRARAPGEGAPDAYLTGDRWFQGLEGPKPTHIAYFSPEFGVDAHFRSIPAVSASSRSDHLKSASRPGRSPSRASASSTAPATSGSPIGADGWQVVESYPPPRPLRAGADPPARDGRDAHRGLARPAGRARTSPRGCGSPAIGRIPLLLLDCRRPRATRRHAAQGHRPPLRGGGEHRLHQELLLGVGGVRALRLSSRVTGRPAPEVYHTNEGHAGFPGRERMPRAHVGCGPARSTRRSPGACLDTRSRAHTSRSRRGSTASARDLIAAYFGGATRCPDRGRPGACSELGAEDWEGGDPAVFNMAVLGLHLGRRATASRYAWPRQPRDVRAAPGRASTTI